MHLKIQLTCILISISPIFAEDIANKGFQRTQSDENEFSNVSFTRNTGLPNKRKENSENINPRISVFSRIANSNLTKNPNSQLNLQNVSDNDSEHQTDRKVAETRGRRGRRYHKNFEDSDIFDDLESDFSFDDMGSDVRGYDSYHGSESNKKRKKRRGPPRYPPIDKDTLYEVGLLIYLRDFHLGMII